MNERNLNLKAKDTLTLHYKRIKEKKELFFYV